MSAHEHRGTGLLQARHPGTSRASHTYLHSPSPPPSALPLHQPSPPQTLSEAICKYPENAGAALAVAFSDALVGGWRMGWYNWLPPSQRCAPKQLLLNPTHSTRPPHPALPHRQAYDAASCGTTCKASAFAAATAQALADAVDLCGCDAPAVAVAQVGLGQGGAELWPEVASAAAPP